MEIIKKEYILCPCCMEEHEVLTIARKEKLTYKGILVEHDVIYNYCCNDHTEYETEEQMVLNNKNLGKAYREQISTRRQ